MSATASTWRGSPEWLAHSRAVCAGEYPKRSTPPPATNGSACRGFSALRVNVGFDSFAELQAKMIAEVPALGVEGLADYGKLPKPKAAKAKGAIRYPIQDFYLTNPIARASVVMQQCSAELLHDESIAEAAE